MSLRVTGGALRGRRLDAPRGQAVRPTSSRVRESLFSILGPSSFDRVLDLFAGAGTLGIEAGSRGADRVVFVEVDGTHARVLAKNVALLDGVADAEILRMDARRAPGRLGRSGSRFDLVFLDPPYDKGMALPTLEALDQHGVVDDGGRVVVESDSREALPDTVGALHREDRRTYGSTALTFYRGPSSEVAP